MNLVIAVVTEREEGVLKRRRSTPVPPWALIDGRALTAVAVVTLAVLMLIGRIAYGVAIPGRTMPAVLAASAWRRSRCAASATPYRPGSPPSTPSHRSCR